MKNISWRTFIMKNGSCGKYIAWALLSVIGIVLLAGIVMVNNVSPKRGENARIHATWSSIAVIRTEVELYKINDGVLPDNLEQLVKKDSDVSGINRNWLYDAWGTPFRYTKIDEDTFEIRSAGPDKLMDTDDDIWN